MLKITFTCKWKKLNTIYIKNLGVISPKYTQNQWGEEWEQTCCSMMAGRLTHRECMGPRQGRALCFYFWWRALSKVIVRWNISCSTAWLGSILSGACGISAEWIILLLGWIKRVTWLLNWILTGTDSSWPGKSRLFGSRSTVAAWLGIVLWVLPLAVAFLELLKEEEKCHSTELSFCLSSS